MKNFKIQLLCQTMMLAVAAMMLVPAQASIVVSVSGLVSAGHVESFTGLVLAPDTVVTDQYAGLTFSATAGGAVRANGCGIGAFASEFSGNQVGTFGSDCEVNAGDDSFSLKFAGPVSAASFELRDYRGDLTNRFAALLGGVEVDSFVHDASTDSGSPPYIYGGGSPISLLFTNTVFDEIRYTENSFSQSGYLILGELRWNDAESVPEPVSLALVGLGLIGVAASRRRTA